MKPSSTTNVNMGSPFKVPAGYMPDPNNPNAVVRIPGSTNPEQQKYNKEYSGILGITKSFTRLGDTLKEIGIQPGAGPLSLDPTKRAKLQSNYKATQLALKNAFELGVLSADDARILTEFLADPTSFEAKLLGDEGMAASYNSGLDYLQDRMDTLSSQYTDTGVKLRDFPKLNKINIGDNDSSMTQKQVIDGKTYIKTPEGWVEQ